MDRPAGPRPLAVVALGGNALLPPDEPASMKAERAAARGAALAVGRIAATYRVVVTHGNGPQVGAILARSDAAGDEAYAVPMDVAVAQSQGEIGYLLQEALADILPVPAVPVVTRVLVDPEDPAFRHPTKPVGPDLDPAHVAELRRRGVPVSEGPEPRRLVPSPEPRGLLEVEALRRLVEDGVPVVAAGGGGVPVVRRGSGYEGVAAVVDKDLASALLAREVDADALFLLTDVARVHLDHGTPQEEALETLTVEEARRGLAAGQFPPGSMGPKVEAALRVLTARPGAHVVIGSLADAPQGTHVVP